MNDLVLDPKGRRLVQAQGAGAGPRRVYNMALDEFMAWFRLEPRTASARRWSTPGELLSRPRGLGSWQSKNRPRVLFDFVSRLTTKTKLCKTENACSGKASEIRARNLPKYILFQTLTAVSSAQDEFFLLQCRTRGAKLSSVDNIGPLRTQDL